jgi:hypothetical protein
MGSPIEEILVYDVAAFANMKLDMKLQSEQPILDGKNYLSMSHSISICF